MTINVTDAAVNGIITFVLVSSVGFVTACALTFLDVCMKPGNIFTRYRTALAMRVLRRRAPAVLQEMLLNTARKIKHPDDRPFMRKKLIEAIHQQGVEIAGIEKPLGLCMICNQPWSMLLMYPALCIGFGLEYCFVGWWHVFGWLCVTVVGNFFLRKML